jgi:uncharacterized protein (TIGR02147 family)
MGKSSSNLSIYATIDYRKALRTLVEARQISDRTLTFQSLAESTRIPKSYISKVLSGSANLSSDQAFALGKALGLSPEEMKYFLLLLERERSGLKERQRELDSEISFIQEKHLQTKVHLSNAGLTELSPDYSLYYLPPWAQIVHIGMTIPKFAKNPDLLRDTLDIGGTEFLYTIRTLEKMKLLTPQKNGYEVALPKTHISPDSPYYRAWKIQQDALANSAFLNRRDAKHYGYSVTFSATEAVRDEFRRKFLKMLQEAQELAAKSDCESVFQMRFDLFSWTP